MGADMISWMSRKKDPIVLSIFEAEYVVACEVGKEVVVKEASDKICSRILWVLL